MASFRHYIKNLPKEFGKVFEAILAVFGRLNPEDIAKIRDWSRNEETGKRGENIPDAFIPYIAWEMGCLYEALYFDRFQERITADDILKYKDLRRYEGTDYGLKNAIELIPAIESAEISRTLGENALPACVFRLIAKLADDREFEKKDWKFFYYLVNDYKRKSAKCLIDFQRDVEVHPLKVNHAVRCDRIVEFGVQLVPGFVSIASIENGETIRIGTNLTISGVAGFDDGATVSLYRGEALIGTATVSGNAFSYTWRAAGASGSDVIRAVCEEAEDSVSVEFVVVIVVNEPVENQAVTVGTAFDVSVQSVAEGNVSVYIGNALIASIPIEDGLAEGTAVIPDSLAGVGSAFIVDGGGETPAGGDLTIPLRFADANGDATVNVKAALGEHFVVGTAIGTMGFTADRTINGEFELEASGQVGYTPEEVETADFVLEAEGSVSVTDS